MRWLERLFSKPAEPQPEPKRIADLGEPGQRVELVGLVEALTVLHDPVKHEPAVVLLYRGWPTNYADPQAPFADTGGEVEAQQATDFVLRDPSGAALMEIDPGVDVGAIHQRLLHVHRAAVGAEVELIAPGDRVRVQGRVRDGLVGSSPHRREDWTAVVVVESIELDSADG